MLSWCTFAYSSVGTHVGRDRRLSWGATLYRVCRVPKYVTVRLCNSVILECLRLGSITSQKISFWGRRLFCVFCLRNFSARPQKQWQTTSFNLKSLSLPLKNDILSKMGQLHKIFATRRWIVWKSWWSFYQITNKCSKHLDSCRSCKLDCLWILLLCSSIVRFHEAKRAEYLLQFREEIVSFTQEYPHVRAENGQ